MRLKHIELFLFLMISSLSFGQCIISIDTAINPTCGENNGYIRVTIEGDIEEENLSWGKDGVWLGDGGLEKSGLGSGNFSISAGGSCGDGSVDGRVTLTAIESELPEINLESVSNETCPGDADGIAIIDVDGGEGELRYFWSNGSTNQNATSLSPGLYTVTVEDELGCRDTLVDIGVNASNIIVIDSLEDIEIFKGGEKQLTPAITGGNGSLNYAWVPADGVSCNGACEQPRVSYLETTTITVTVTDELGCTSEMSVLVEVLDQIPEIFVPSGFTPNADGSNDVFQVYGQGIEYMTLSIFDRWGKMIHQITDQKESWNGNYANGKPAPTGTYVYILEIEYLSEMGIPLPKPVTGNVTLLRN